MSPERVSVARERKREGGRDERYLLWTYFTVRMIAHGETSRANPHFVPFLHVRRICGEGLGGSVKINRVVLL